MTEPRKGRADGGEANTARPRVADVLRAFCGAARATYVFTQQQNTILDRITRCQTAAMGGHVMQCAVCGEPTPLYNSCRDRHCPQCGWGAQQKWLDERQERLLPVPYFHTVFTIPAELRPLVAANRRQLYALLFHAVASTLLTCARDPKRLGATPAFTLLLHTWDRTLQFHPHIHGVISAGGLTSDGKWKATTRPGRKSFLFPVKVMGKLFKQAFLTAVIDMLRRGDLCIPDTLAADVLDRLRAASRADWVVYAKRPFAGATHVYRYLGRYTHRVGISNSRIIAIDAHSVSFHTKAGQAIRIDGIDFVRRFAQHVLPRGFTRIRHYGLLAPGNVNTRWLEAYAELAPSHRTAPPPEESVDANADSPPAICAGPLAHLCLACFRARRRPAVRAPPELNTS